MNLVTILLDRNGYVRLRCLDEPISERRPLNTPRASGSDFGYAHEPVYSKPYSDGIPEAHSESEEGAPSTGTTSEEDDDMLKFKETMKNMTRSVVSNIRLLHAMKKKLICSCKFLVHQKWYQLMICMHHQNLD